MPLIVKPAQRATPAQKMATKKGFTKWAKSPAGQKYKAIKSNPTKYAQHLTESVKKVQEWIANLKKSNDPLAAQKIKNHMARIVSLKKTIADLKARKAS